MNSCYSYSFKMDDGKDVFLSHDWGKDELGRSNHYRIGLINKGLKELGYQTWFDDECMEDHIGENMSQGIEQSKGVTAFITRRYHDKVNSKNYKDNCKIEFDYASRTQTSSKMLAFVMEKSMLDTNSWKGLVGSHLGGHMYVDMSGDLENKTYFSQQLKDLQRRLQSKGIQPLPGNFISYFNFHYYHRKRFTMIML